MHASLEVFPEPVAILDTACCARESNAAWREAFGEDAPAALGLAGVGPLSDVLGGLRPRAEVDAPAGEASAPRHRFTIVPLPGPEGDPQALVHARPLPPGPSREELLQERTLLRQIIDAAPFLIFMKDGHGHFLWANEAVARTLGVTLEQLVHRFQGEILVDEGEAEGYLTMDRHVLSTRETVVFEEKVTRPDGDVRWMETMKKPLVLPSGEVQVIGFSVDVTDRNRAQRALERTALEREEMAVAARREAVEKSALIEELDRKLAIIEAQHGEIAALAAPLLEAGDGILGVPILGAMDEPRAAALTARVLAAIAERQVRGVVLDLSGLEAVDPRTADRLLGIIRAIGLLGARAVITGIRPAVAEAMVALEIDLSMITTRRTPKDAMRFFAGERR